MNMKIGDIAFHDLTLADISTFEESRTLPGVMVVPATAPAIPIAEAAEGSGVELIIVSGIQGEITGLVFPEWALSQIDSMRPENPSSFKEALEILLDDPAEKARNYHHERLNLDRPVIFKCAQGPHYVNANPCPWHGTTAVTI